LKVALIHYAYFEDVKGYGVVVADHEVLRAMYEEGLLTKFRFFSKVPGAEVESYLAKAEKLLEPIVERLKSADPESVMYVYGSEEEVVRLVEMTRPRLVIVDDGVVGRFERELGELEGVDVYRYSEAISRDISLDMRALEIPAAVTEALFNMLSTYANLVVRVSARRRISLDDALQSLGLFKKIEKYLT